jgi:hypothetical protein
MTTNDGNAQIHFEPILYPGSSHRILLHVHVPYLPGNVFRLGIVEWVGNGNDRLLLWSDMIAPWKTAAAGAFQLEWTKPDVCRAAVTLKPCGDMVEAAMEIRNLGANVWSDAYIFPCLAMQHAPDFADPDMARTFMVAPGNKLQPLADTRRITATQRPMMQSYTMNARTLPLNWDGFAGTSPDPAAQPFMAVGSQDGRWTAGMGADSARFLFNNADYSCLHVCNDLRVMAPGESKTAKSRLYFMEGQPGDCYRRWQSDFNNIISDGTPQIA